MTTDAITHLKANGVEQSLRRTIASVKMNHRDDMKAPQSEASRNPDNTFTKQTLKWEPNTPLDKELAATYGWRAKSQWCRQHSLRFA